MVVGHKNNGNSDVKISIVIITRNEAKNIARGIESVLQVIQGKTQIELLLVDSASTDATVEIASQYPIRIIRLKSDWFHSVSAGRFIGMLNTHGELVLHMDGDMELDPQWLDRSVGYLTEHPDVGAVGGYWRNVNLVDGQIVSEEDEFRFDRIMEVRYVGGAAVYRRSAIQKMGGFQPYLRGEEGVYMSMGIRFAGYKVVYLPYLMSRHFCIPRKSLAGGTRKFKLGFFLGYGQVLRSYVGSKIFWIYLWERSLYTAAYLTGILVFLVSLSLMVILKNIWFLTGCLIIYAIVILLFAIKKHSFYEALKSLLVQTWVAYSTVRGFFMPFLPSSEYPTDAEIVKELHN